MTFLRSEFGIAYRSLNLWILIVVQNFMLRPPLLHLRLHPLLKWLLQAHPEWTISYNTEAFRTLFQKSSRPLEILKHLCHTTSICPRKPSRRGVWTFKVPSHPIMTFSMSFRKCYLEMGLLPLQQATGLWQDDF